MTARVNDDGWDTCYVNWLKGSKISNKDLIFVFSVGGGNLEKNISVNILKSLQLSKSIKSNKTVSFRVLAQIASAVPKRVKFKSIEYNGADLVIIEGSEFSDQDILKLISNLNNKKLISQASLASMTLPNEQQNSQTMKGFKIACVLESV